MGKFRGTQKKQSGPSKPHVNKYAEGSKVAKESHKTQEERDQEEKERRARTAAAKRAQQPGGGYAHDAVRDRLKEEEDLKRRGRTPFK